MNVAHHQRHEPFDALAMQCGLLAARARRRQMSFKTQDTEMSPSGGKVRICYLDYSIETHTLFYGLMESVTTVGLSPSLQEQGS